MSDRIDRVRSFFAEPEQYLRVRGDFNIRIRAEVVQGLVGPEPVDTILDIGCGNGAISLPLLRGRTRLTLLDISRNMLDLASARIPADARDRVTLVNDDFMAADLPTRSFDLILCLGVLAHVDSPTAVIERMANVLRPGGRVIVQNNDARHPLGYLLSAYSSLSRKLLPEPYVLNRIRSDAVIKDFGRHGLRLVGGYRYAMPLPGMTRLFSGDQLYRAIRTVHGTEADNQRAWLGSECIFEFRR